MQRSAGKWESQLCERVIVRTDKGVRESFPAHPETRAEVHPFCN